MGAPRGAVAAHEPAAIHDEYFELDPLEHDADRGELRLAIYRGRRKKWWFIETGRPPENPLPPPIGTLVVHNVLAVSVNDEADIGWYDVNRLEYEADAGELTRDGIEAAHRPPRGQLRDQGEWGGRGGTRTPDICLVRAAL